MGLKEANSTFTETDRRDKYNELLMDDRWQEKRYEIFRLRGHYCSKCKKKNKRHDPIGVHHIKYTGYPWEAPNDDLIALCRQCHAEVHDDESSFTNKDCRALIEQSNRENNKYGSVWERQMKAVYIILSHLEDGKFYNRASLPAHFKKCHSHIRLRFSLSLRDLLRLTHQYLRVEYINKKKDISFNILNEEEIEEMKEFYPDFSVEMLNVISNQLKL